LHLSIRELTVDFPAPDGGTLPALGPLTLEVEDQQFVCVLGPSGCGKSTLIRIIAGLQRATTGGVWSDGKQILKPLPDVAVMFQDANLMPWRTVIDNIALPLELAGMSPKERYSAVQNLLPQLNLQQFESAYPGELSGGMAQRVALGRVIIQQPQVLLLDEPFGALDALTREKVSMDLLQVWQQTKQTVIMVTHDINEAVLLADRIIVLSQRPGQIVADIPVMLSRPRQIDMIYTDEFVSLSRRVRQAIEI